MSNGGFITQRFQRGGKPARASFWIDGEFNEQAFRVFLDGVIVRAEARLRRKRYWFGVVATITGPVMLAALLVALIGPEHAYVRAVGITALAGSFFFPFVVGWMLLRWPRITVALRPRWRRGPEQEASRDDS